MIPVTGSTVRSIVSTLMTCDVAGLGYFCHMPRMTRDHSCLEDDRRVSEARRSARERKRWVWLSWPAGLVRAIARTGN
jgi:hypothetical protein